MGVFSIVYRFLYAKKNKGSKQVRSTFPRGTRYSFKTRINKLPSNKYKEMKKGGVCVYVLGSPPGVVDFVEIYT